MKPACLLLFAVGCVVVFNVNKADALSPVETTTNDDEGTENKGKISFADDGTENKGRKGRKRGGKLREKLGEMMGGGGEGSGKIRDMVKGKIGEAMGGMGGGGSGRIRDMIAGLKEKMGGKMKDGNAGGISGIMGKLSGRNKKHNTEEEE